MDLFDFLAVFVASSDSPMGIVRMDRRSCQFYVARFFKMNKLYFIVLVVLSSLVKGKEPIKEEYTLEMRGAQR